MQLTIETMTYGPDGLAHDADGKTVFVRGGLAGDVVEAHVTEDGKKFSHAVVDEVLEPSASRVQAPCPFVDVCGGCPWGSLSYEAQLAAKEENLHANLQRIGGFSEDEVETLVRPIRPSKDHWGYRNKIELAPAQVNGRLRLGLHGRDPEQVVHVDSCPLFEKRFPKAVKGTEGALGFLANGNQIELERVGLRASRRTGALEVALWTPTGGFPRAQASRVLASALDPTSVVRVMTKGSARARRVAGVERLSGEGSWTEQLADGPIRISAPSFFQVNTAGADALVELVLEALRPERGDLAIDLYCGAGTFTLPLAWRCDWVYGVESSGPAVRDLRRNVEDAELDNVDVIGGDAAHEFPGADADVIVVDPPRSGLSREVVELVSGTSARDVAYVSCDPATLARDLARLRDAGTFLPASITPVDLFPQTYHCEAVVHLERMSR